jgi:hypothetical protein
MEPAESLAGLSAATATAVARAALGRPRATALTWEAIPLGGSLGAATAGLYRVTGSAGGDGAAAPRSWAAVLKVLRPPQRSRHSAGLRDPQHWAYWQREPLAYTSGLLADLPGGLAAPRLLLADEAGAGGGEVVRLWLEAVTDRYAGRWPPDQLGRTARHLGAFNGAYLAGRPLPQAPWLGRHYLRQRFDQARRDGGWPLFGGPRTWQHPLLAGAFPAGCGERLGRLWDGRDALLDALDALPQTLRHGDTHRSNCFAPPAPAGGDEERTVAVDWGTLGIGPVGAEAIELALGVFTGDDGLRPGRPPAAEAIYTAYVQGLRAAGWRGDARLARLGFAATAALTGASRLHWTLQRLLDGEGRTAPEGRTGLPAATQAWRWGAQTGYLLELADEAAALAGGR